jgi:hypothetical protein
LEGKAHLSTPGQPPSTPRYIPLGGKRFYRFLFPFHCPVVVERKTDGFRDFIKLMTRHNKPLPSRTTFLGNLALFQLPMINYCKSLHISTFTPKYIGIRQFEKSE